MISSKKTYFGIAGGMLFLFLLSSITFIIIGINKDEPLFENVAITISLAMSLLLLLVGFCVSLYLALKKRQISEK
jgi:CDP-diglyceride synthetase